MPPIALEIVDQVEVLTVLTVMDDTVDVLVTSTSVAHRAPLRRDVFSRPRLRAEHGVSMLVTIHYQGKKEVILFDARTTDDGALHNMDVLELKPKDLHAVVLGHGHSDHTLGLIGLLKRFGRPRGGPRASRRKHHRADHPLLPTLAANGWSW